ncbi:T-cell surface antigen CD2-like [Cololabis saira]|uniref:T-cell surface antigen CD2-like n=1 Tax=Cololabis saira TaxID=129043 RepID=UPI002AD3762B|nr:T-cell surface antigen CD2-like [Cololabis saira]
MACFSATFGVITALGLVHLSAANRGTCDVYAAVGQNVTLPFVYEGLPSSHSLKWTHNNSTIFYRKHGKMTHGKPEDITATGSLLLQNIKSISEGIYQATVLRPNNTLAKSWTGRLCVMEKVHKPHLSYVCDVKSNAVNLNCHVAKPQSVVFSWTLDKKVLPSETKQTLSFSLSQLKEEKSFSCSVANSVSKEISNTVRPACKAPSPAPQLLCLKPIIVVAALAGGAALIVLLLIAVMVLCCCLRRSRSQMKVKENSGLRMLSLKRRELDCASPMYETMHRTEPSPPATPQPSQRASYQSLSPSEVQTEEAPQQLSPAVEPSPVPAPRTKNIRKQNI